MARNLVATEGGDPKTAVYTLNEGKTIRHASEDHLFVDVSVSTWVRVE